MKTVAPDATKFRFCPVCQISLDRHEMVCRDCGGVPGVENARMAVMAFFNGLFSKASGLGVSRLVLLWILASIPLLIGPPILAIVLICLSTFRDRALLSPVVVLNYIAIVALSGVNIGFSFQFSPVVAEHVFRVLFAVKNAFTHWVNEIFTLRIAPGGGGMPYNGGGGRSA